MLEQAVSWIWANARWHPESWLLARRMGSDVLGAAIFVALGSVAYLLLPATMTDRSAVLTHFPAVTLAALCLGQRAALIVIILSGVMIVFWLSPVYDAEHLTELAVFAIGSLLIVGTMEAIHRKRARLQHVVAKNPTDHDEALSALTGGVAHDLNNLLSVISGNHQLIEMNLTDDRQRHFLVEAERAVQIGIRLNRRLMTSAFSGTAADVDLNNIILSMRELVRAALGERIVMSTILGADLWQTQADPTDLENALLNLVINARDAMPDGGHLRIETRNTWGKDADLVDNGKPCHYVCLTVADSGRGMTPEVAARAFEPFFTTKEHGRGFGLARLYSFVKQAGGQVRLRSEAGKGTAVSVYLPAIKPSSTLEAPHS
jgi:signal transduction histidine kinase